MTMMQILLKNPLLITYILLYIFVIIAVVASAEKRPVLLFIFKPIPVISLLLLLLVTASLDNLSSYLVFTGLIFGLSGDLFLIRPEKYFAFGLICFFIGHILYTIAFLQNGIFPSKLIIIPLVLYYVLISVLLLPSVFKKQKNLFLPVLLYLSVIFFMSLSASFYDASLNRSLFFMGAICFTISDGFLAYDFFVKKIRIANFFVYPLYFIAQFLIAMSTIYISHQF